MVLKKKFALLVATGTTPFFAVFSIICDHHNIDYLAKHSVPTHNLCEKFQQHLQYKQ